MVSILEGPPWTANTRDSTPCAAIEKLSCFHMWGNKPLPSELCFYVRVSWSQVLQICRVYI
jgi:hypothetical protein